MNHLTSLGYRLILAVYLLAQFGTTAQAQTKFEWKTATDAKGTSYRYVTNDPTHTKFYTLSNGLSVILCENKKSPTIQYKMVVRAGSNNDPRDHTGLAHYLEHLLFKGTEQFGTLNWAKEKPYIDSIYTLYEQYNATGDADKRKAIYKEIDRVSGIASHYSASNEYDKLMKMIGSSGTNAHTYTEETVFHENFPYPEMDRFLMVQADRFKNPVFRLFHTELEAVYEEKNRSTDNSQIKISEIMNASLYPTHNYGQQTTIGTNEHLKSPSLVAIRDFYQKYYVPNNMGLILVGDFKTEEVIKKVEHYFSWMKYKPVEEYKPAPEAPLIQPIEKTVFALGGENLSIAFRTPAANTRDAMMLNFISKMLTNGRVGIMDLNILKQNKLQSASCGMQQQKDYGSFMLNAAPIKGQTLEQAKDILLGQVEKIKKGDFDDDLIEMLQADEKLSMYTILKSEKIQIDFLKQAFVLHGCTKWDWEVAEVDAIGKITKKDVVEAANKYLNDGYVVVYKKKGKPTGPEKVEKPDITPVETNAGKQSDYVKRFSKIPAGKVSPKYVDFKKAFVKGKTGSAEVVLIKDDDIATFYLDFMISQGANHSDLLPIALGYLSFLGTDKFSAAEITKKFFKLGCTYSVQTLYEDTYVKLSGLNENFDAALALMEEVFRNCQPNEQALQAMKENAAKARSEVVTNKAAILGGLAAYAKYGPINPATQQLTLEAMNKIQSKDLIDILHNLFNYKQQIFYVGSWSKEKLCTKLNQLHKLPASFAPTLPLVHDYKVQTQTENQVYFVDYNLVQADISWIRNEGPFKIEDMAISEVYNSYFGGPMAIVFKTIREAKALAYSASAVYQTTNSNKEPSVFFANIGCQADKLNESIQAMNELLNKCPEDEEAFNNARSKRSTQLETERKTGYWLLMTYLAYAGVDIDYDVRKIEYAHISKLKLKDIINFHNQKVANKPWTIYILGSKDKINMEDLKKYGELKIITAEELLGL